MFRYLKTAATLVALGIALALGAGVTLRLALHTGEVGIPDFSGMTVSEASDAALHAGLDLNIENKFYSTTVPAGRVLSQSPAAGSAVRKGWQVRVTESLGPQQVTIPDVVAEPVREATMDLRRDQLDLGTVTHMEAPGDTDLVLAQTPPPDAGVDQPRVNLLLSSATGEGDGSFVMPSFVGMNYTSANHEAIALGLRVATIGGLPATPPPSAAPAAVIAGANGVQLDSNGHPIAAAPAAPLTPVGPVQSQSPEAGFRGTRNAVIRLYFTRPSSEPAAASGTSASPGTTATVPVQTPR